jgi:hypothetical protein
VTLRLPSDRAVDVVPGPTLTTLSGWTLDALNGGPFPSSRGYDAHRARTLWRERMRPEADGALVASARGLEEVMGPMDPLLVPALQEMAQAQLRMGELR